MQPTYRNFTSHRVAGEDRAEAIAWLMRRRAWDDRLRDLEGHRAGRAASPVVRAAQRVA